MALNATIIRHDGALAIECLSFSTMHDKPQRVRHVWVMSRYQVRGMGGRDPESAIGRPATIQDGRISCYLGEGTYLYGEMERGGDTPAVVVEITDVAPPKVRAGTETRWRNDHWQKYLKGKGWVVA